MTIARINVAYCTFGINVSNMFSNTYLHMASLDSHARKSSKKKTKHFTKPFIIFSSGFNSHFSLCLIACFLTHPKWYIFKYPEIQSIANYLCCNGNCLCGLFYFQNPYSALFSLKKEAIYGLILCHYNILFLTLKPGTLQCPPQLAGESTPPLWIYCFSLFSFPEWCSLTKFSCIDFLTFGIHFANVLRLW